MIGYLNGEKLLTESDLPPQWNLLSGTSDWSGDWINKDKYTITTKRDSNGNLLLHRVGSWFGIQKSINAFVNQIFTFSICVTNLQNTNALAVFSNVSQPLMSYVDGKKIQVAATGQFDTSKINDSSEHKLSFTFQTSKDGAFSARIENPNDNGAMDLSSMKLEHGSKSTQWMPAISDLMLKNQNGGVRATKPLVSMFYVPSLEMEAA